MPSILNCVIHTDLFYSFLDLKKSNHDLKEELNQLASDFLDMKQPLRSLESRSEKNTHAIETNFSELVRNYNTINQNLKTIKNITDSINKDCDNGCKYIQRNITARKSYRSCLELLRCGFSKSGKYIVEPSLGYKKEVFCDQLTDGGGWTLFLRNKYGNISFNKGWLDYKNGFGDLDYDFWLGNDFLFKATTLHNLHESNTTQLYISLVDKANATLYIKYNNFAVFSEKEKYKLRAFGHMYGTAGDSLEYHNNMNFSTNDQDNDNSENTNCVVRFDARRGWWFNNCYKVQLSSTFKDYCDPNTHKCTPGPVWEKVHNNYAPLKSATMMFREK